MYSVSAKVWSQPADIKLGMTHITSKTVVYLASNIGLVVFFRSEKEIILYGKVKKIYS